MKGTNLGRESELWSRLPWQHAVTAAHGRRTVIAWSVGRAAVANSRDRSSGNGERPAGACAYLASTGASRGSGARTVAPPPMATPPLPPTTLGPRLRPRGRRRRAGPLAPGRRVSAALSFPWPSSIASAAGREIRRIRPDRAGAPTGMLTALGRGRAAVRRYGGARHRGAGRSAG